MLSLISKVIAKVLQPILTALTSIIIQAVLEALSSIFYWVTILLVNLVQDVYVIFEVFAGIKMAKYGGKSDYIINIFLRNDEITGIYWGMTAIGVVLLFLFAIIAVIRTMFDMGEKRQSQPLGEIITGCLKGIFVMVSLTAILVASLDIVNMLVERVDAVFDKGAALLEKTEIHFTDEQFAAMARIYNTIGEYSLNPSYDHRYNLNTCYNDIREDLVFLQDDGVFDFNYPILTEIDTHNAKNIGMTWLMGDLYEWDESTPLDGATLGEITKYKDANPGQVILNWQNVLQMLVNVRDPEEPVNIDSYDQPLFTMLKDIMELLQKGGEFLPLKEYKVERTERPDEAHLDRLLFLSGTMQCARNSRFNENPSLNDGARAPFYSGQKSIYNQSNVESTFYISALKYQYITVWIFTFFFLRSLLIAIWNAVARVVNIVALYIIAPPVAATIPMDGGEKFKQWTISMVIQMFGIFGVIVPMRLVFTFMPIILSPSFMITENIITNFMGKILMIIGMLFAVEKFYGVLTGILANNAGAAAIDAGNVGAGAFSTMKSGAQALNRMRKEAKKGKGEKENAAKEKDKAEGSDTGIGASNNESNGSKLPDKTTAGDEKSETNGDGLLPQNESDSNKQIPGNEGNGDLPDNNNANNQENDEQNDNDLPDNFGFNDNELDEAGLGDNNENNDLGGPGAALLNQNRGDEQDDGIGPGQVDNLPLNNKVDNANQNNPNKGGNKTAPESVDKVFKKK